MNKHYVLKRYYPNIEDDDNEEIIYITENYKEALEKAVWIHKADIEALYEEYEDEDDREYYYSTVEVEIYGNTEISEEQYSKPKRDEVYYSKTTRVNIGHDASERIFKIACRTITLDYYLKLDENMEYIDMCIPQEIIDNIRDDMRVAKVYCGRYSNGMNISFRVIKQDVNRLDDYDEQINQLVEEVIEHLNDGETKEDMENYILEVFNNVSLD